MRQRLTTLLFLLPPSRLKVRLLNRLGHAIHPTARVGICFVQRVERFELAEGVRIGHFNMFRFLARVQMGRGSRIVMFNWLLGGSGFEAGPDADGSRRVLQMGDHSHIISNHYLDCGGGLIMGDDCWITGVRSTILTHAFDPYRGGLIIEPVVLKKGAVVATNCTLLPGAVVGEGSLIAAGSTIWTRQEVPDGALVGGVPARRLSPISIAAEAYKRHRYGG